MLGSNLFGGAQGDPGESGGILAEDLLFPCVSFAVQVRFLTAEELDRLGDEAIKEKLLSWREWFGDWDPERFDFEATAREMTRRVVYGLGSES